MKKTFFLLVFNFYVFISLSSGQSHTIVTDLFSILSNKQEIGLTYKYFTKNNQQFWASFNHTYYLSKRITINRDFDPDFQYKLKKRPNLSAEFAYLPIKYAGIFAKYGVINIEKTEYFCVNKIENSIECENIIKANYGSKINSFGGGFLFDVPIINKGFQLNAFAKFAFYLNKANNDFQKPNGVDSNGEDKDVVKILLWGNDLVFRDRSYYTIFNLGLHAGYKF